MESFLIIPPNKSLEPLLNSINLFKDNLSKSVKTYTKATRETFKPFVMSQFLIIALTRNILPYFL